MTVTAASGGTRHAAAIAWLGKAGERIFGATLLAAGFGPALEVVICGVQPAA